MPSVDISKILRDELIEEVRQASVSGELKLKPDIFSIMGPNGSGKTRLLDQAFKFLQTGNFPVLYISALRSTNKIWELDIGNRSPSTTVEVKFSTIEELVDVITDSLFVPLHSQLTMIGHRSPQLTYDTALNILINNVLTKDHHIRSENNRRITDWNNNGDREKNVELPEKQKEFWPDIQTMLNGVFEYDFYLTEIGGNAFNSGDKDIRYRVNGIDLGISALSLGEKQTMLMSILMFVKKEKRQVVLIDEPELHLNEQKAIETWSKVESYLPNSVFVYATHNVAFATRSEVSKLYFMKLDETIEHMPLDNPLPSYALRAIVGSRIQLIRTDKPVIFCEDELSKAILSDIFIGDRYSVIAVPGKDSVIRGAKPNEAWNTLIAGDRKCCGIVDRDARNDAQVADLKKQRTICLPFNEIESLLLHPDLMVPLLKSVRGDDKFPKDEYAKIVAGCAESEITDSLTTLQNYITEQVRVNIRFKRTQNGIEVTEIVGPEVMKDRFSAEAGRLLIAIKTSDIDTILSLSCGKEVFQRMARESEAKFKVAISSEPAKFYNMIRDKAGMIERIRSLPGMRELMSDVRTVLS